MRVSLAPTPEHDAFAAEQGREGDAGDKTADMGPPGDGFFRSYDDIEELGRDPKAQHPEGGDGEGNGDDDAGEDEDAGVGEEENIGAHDPGDSAGRADQRAIAGPVEEQMGKGR